MDNLRCPICGSASVFRHDDVWAQCEDCDYEDHIAAFTADEVPKIEEN